MKKVRRVFFADDVMPDGKALAAMWVTFFLIIMTLPMVQPFGEGVIGTLAGALLAALIMLSVIFIVSRLGWTRPRRDGEWL